MEKMISSNYKNPGVTQKTPSTPNEKQFYKVTDAKVSKQMQSVTRSTSGNNKNIHPDFGVVGSATHAKIGK